MTSITNLLLPILNIAISDIVLAADNAVVIAMMVLSLPLQQRRQGILFGTLAAVILRIALTFGVSQLLTVSGLKLVGGALILWIAWKVLTANSDPDQHAPQPAGLIRAVFMILLADITMSLDNVLAIAAASHGNLMLIILGLALSIPLVMLASDTISRLMSRWPIIQYVGALALGRVGTSLMLEDPWFPGVLAVAEHSRWMVELTVAVLIVAAAHAVLRVRQSQLIKSSVA